MLDLYPLIFRQVSAMRTLRWLNLYNSELLDILFNLKRVVRTLLMSTCSIKQVRLASSPVPHYITVVDLTHFHSEPLLTFAFWRFLLDLNQLPCVWTTTALPNELKNQYVGCRCAVGLVS